MTDLLAALHHSFGLLHITLMTMEQARIAWAGKLGPVMTDAELLRGKFEEEEPVLMVRCTSTTDWQVRDATEDDLCLLANEQPMGVPKPAQVWELHIDDFFYFKAFRTGIADLTKDLPQFFYGMTLVHAWGLFEHYLGSLLLRILHAHPDMLGREKQLDLGEVLDYPTKETLLASVAEKEIRNLFYKPVRDWLKALRGRYKLEGLTRAHDDDLIENALVRNCVVHNRGVADDRLEKQTGGRCIDGVPIALTLDTVMKATDTIRKFASTLDETAVQVHLTPSDSK
jgi:hypothetical protein